MKRLAISFRSGFTSTLLGHAGGSAARALACVAALACVGGGANAVWWAYTLQAEMRSSREALAKLNTLAAPAARPAPTRAFGAQHGQAMNRVVRQLNTPWSTIFDTLEQQTGSEIAPVSIEPDPGRGNLRLVAEARRLQDLLAFAERLRRSGAFAQVDAAKHEISDRDPVKPVRLTLDITLAGHPAIASTSAP